MNRPTLLIILYLVVSLYTMAGNTSELPRFVVNLKSRGQIHVEELKSGHKRTVRQSATDDLGQPVVDPEDHVIDAKDLHGQDSDLNRRLNLHKRKTQEFASKDDDGKGSHSFNTLPDLQRSETILKDTKDEVGREIGSMSHMKDEEIRAKKEMEEALTKICELITIVESAKNVLQVAIVAQSKEIETENAMLRKNINNDRVIGEQMDSLKRVMGKMNAEPGVTDNIQDVPCPPGKESGLVHYRSKRHKALLPKHRKIKAEPVNYDAILKSTYTKKGNDMDMESVQKHSKITKVHHG